MAEEKTLKQQRSALERAWKSNVNYALKISDKLKAEHDNYEQMEKELRKLPTKDSGRKELQKRLAASEKKLVNHLNRMNQRLDAVHDIEAQIKQLDKSDSAGSAKRA